MYTYIYRCLYVYLYVCLQCQNRSKAISMACKLVESRPDYGGEHHEWPGKNWCEQAASLSICRVFGPWWTIYHSRRFCDWFYPIIMGASFGNTSQWHTFAKKIQRSFKLYDPAWFGCFWAIWNIDQKLLRVPFHYRVRESLGTGSRVIITVFIKSNWKR